MKKSKFISSVQKFFLGLFRVLRLIFKGIIDVLIYLQESHYSTVDWDSDEFEEEKTGLLHQKGRNIKLTMALASVAIKADGRVLDKELEYVRLRFKGEYSEEITGKWMEFLEDSLKVDYSLSKLCAKVNRWFSQSTKIQLLHFLCGVVTREGMLTEDEFNVLKDISRRIRLPFSTFKSILALYDFITEEQYKANQKRKSSEKKRTSAWKLEKSYSILEIDKSATNEEVKKAFRKLAKVHHPDKVSHMGESFKKSAHKKFKQILDAYEKIKGSRGMN